MKQVNKLKLFFIYYIFLDLTEEKHNLLIFNNSKSFKDEIFTIDNFHYDIGKVNKNKYNLYGETNLCFEEYDGKENNIFDIINFN